MVKVSKPLEKFFDILISNFIFNIFASFTILHILEEEELMKIRFMFKMNVVESISQCKANLFYVEGILDILFPF